MKQVILERLLLADVGRAREQEIAAGNTNRPMGREKDLFDVPVGDAFFRYGGAAGAEQFNAGVAALA